MRALALSPTAKSGIDTYAANLSRIIRGEKKALNKYCGKNLRCNAELVSVNEKNVRFG